MGRYAVVHLCAALFGLAACGGSGSPTTPTTPTTPAPSAPTGPTAPQPGLALSGDPASANGATWAFQAQVGGVAFDLQGVLFKPAGSGPFPAVIISHGAGGSAMGYSRTVARVMAGWGLVCIATNYTHAGGVPIGSPGTAAEQGASEANVRRARQLVDVLATLGYVDTTRIALHGHSMGAFVTAATLAAHPQLFRAASHTAGGARPDSIAGPAPSETQVASIRTPYQLHHGTTDVVVLLSSDERLAAVLADRGVAHELRVYPGVDHSAISQDPVVFARIREWFARFGMF